MINKIFFDIDETLIHTAVSADYIEEFHAAPKKHVFCCEGDLHTYHSCIRPCSNELIDLARELVGFDDVYILTQATKDYACEINVGAGWEFADANIIARADINAFTSAYLASPQNAVHDVYDTSNVLIDNLPYYENRWKMRLIGIDNDKHKSNYLDVDDYFGDNSDDQEFKEMVMKFLTTKHIKLFS
jgi:hypothetical protein